MRSTLIALCLASFAYAADTDFVDAQRYDYSLRLDIRYATPFNFTKHAVYPEAKCYLREPVVKALARVQAALKLREMGLKLYDCYRPLSVQKRFWSLVPDERYVADPAKGSRHNRGAAVDLTLVDKRGDELPMPSEFDDFTEKAHRDYKKGSKAARRNRDLLEKVMVAEGFQPFPTEWWHFDYPGWEKFPIDDVSFQELDKRKR